MGARGVARDTERKGGGDAPRLLAVCFPPFPSMFSERGLYSNIVLAQSALLAVSLVGSLN